ncbi:hypothetical protein NFI96_004053, partial [Prochilodus magdalenae]
HSLDRPDTTGASGASGRAPEHDSTQRDRRVLQVSSRLLLNQIKDDVQNSVGMPLPIGPDSPALFWAPILCLLQAKRLLVGVSGCHGADIHGILCQHLPLTPS